MLKEIFRCPDGSYSEKNKFWSSWGLIDLIDSLPVQERAQFTQRVDALKEVYAQMSATYQEAKKAGKGANTPLK